MFISMLKAKVLLAAAVGTVSLDGVAATAIHQPHRGGHHQRRVDVGNLVVRVPSVPSRRALKPLCRDLLAAESGQPAARVRLDQPVTLANDPGGQLPGGVALTGATGGTAFRTTAWCEHYLHHHHHH